MKAEGCSTPVEEDVEVEAGGATPAVETFRVKPLDCTGVEDADTVETKQQEHVRIKQDVYDHL